MVNARKSVIDALVALESSQGYSNLILDSLLKNSQFSAVDRAFASRLFYGVIERKLTLDFYINKLSSKPTKKLTPIVLNSLRIGIYQLEYMSKVPDNSAVNESVDIVKNSKERNAAGFVNAVLRSFLRDKPNLPQDNSFYALSIRYSCPSWFIEELTNYIGKDEAIKFLESSLESPPMYLRVNNCVATTDILTQKFLDYGIDAHQVGDNSLSISGANWVESVDEFKKGHFHIQDISSQLCVSALGLNAGDRLLDICSAPGGKSCTAAEIMNNTGEILSCDLHEHRVKLIGDNARRLNLDIITPIVNDATIFNPNLGLFNKILCDVPCSGFGVIRRKPEIKYKSKSDLTSLSDLQYNILDMSSKYLEKDGVIVYSTCTLRKEENEDVVLRFLKEHTDFETVDVLPQFYCGCGHRLFPENCGGDGFFFSVLKGK